ncbi:TrbG/VirB9 family P-type conjugative transfer protein (plasmid) [Polaromonas sp. P1-6]|nr:TrbG/VirB9 family P-type conjugative transfer protein [Polaromonas sp. P1-6]
MVYTLMVTVGMHTHIPLGQDEELIEKPKLGETVQWRVSGNERNLYIKALKAGTSTSMTLVTDKRLYQFELVATTNANERIQKAYFSYPDDDERMVVSQQNRAAKADAAIKADEAHKREQELSLQPVAMSNLSFYRVEGNKDYERMHVFDDGRQTTMRLPPGIQDLPAVFMVGEDSKLMPVNYTVVDRKGKEDRDVIRIERTSARWLLKINKSVEVKVSKEM